MRTSKPYKNYFCDKLTFMSAPRVALVFVSMTALVVGLVSYTVSMAWSKPYMAATEAVQKSSPPTLTDLCFPLLNSVTPMQSATGSNQRQAGQAAVLGLMIGVQFALAPADLDQAMQNINPAALKGTDAQATPPRTAPAIVAYRQCQKQQALSAMQDVTGQS